MPDAPPKTPPPVADVPSPCTKICRIGARGHCLGCGRELDEIAGWAQLSAEHKRRVRERAAARLRDFKEDAA